MWAAWLAVVLFVLSGVPAAADEPDALAITPPRLSYLDGPVSFWRLGAIVAGEIQQGTFLPHKAG